MRKNSARTLPGPATALFRFGFLRGRTRHEVVVERRLQNFMRALGGID